MLHINTVPTCIAVQCTVDIDTHNDLPAFLSNSAVRFFFEIVDSGISLIVISKLLLNFLC